WITRVGVRDRGSRARAPISSISKACTRPREIDCRLCVAESCADTLQKCLCLRLVAAVRPKARQSRASPKFKRFSPLAPGGFDRFFIGSRRCLGLAERNMALGRKPAQFSVEIQI